MKKNNRGFLLAESLIVSTFVLTILILLYVQFSNLTTNYKNSYNYNNVESIYDLSSIANYLKTNNYDLSSKLTKSKPYVIVFEDDSCNMDAGIIDTFCDNLANKMDAKKIIYTSSDISVIQKYVSENEDTNINQSLRDFITKVETTPVQNKGRLFAEFNNGTYATIVMDDSVTIPDDPITPPTSVKVGGQDVMLVSSGDGLYEDIYEEGRYVYRGQDPDNYIMFNDELWRIIAKETDGTYKIIRNDILKKRPFDKTNDRSTENNSYCQNPRNGCGVYAAVDGTFSSPSGSQSGTVTEDSSIKIYLNDDYYVNNINETAKGQMTFHSFNIGAVEDLDQSGAEADSIEKNIAGEKMYQWTGNVGLANVSDILRASTNPLCTSATTSYNGTNECNSNYLLDKGVASLLNYWTINAYSSGSGGDSDGVWYGFVRSSNAHVNYDTAAGRSSATAPRPVVFLKSDTTLSGSGTSEDPYKIGGSL